MKLCPIILILLMPVSLLALDTSPKISNDIVVVSMSKGPKFISTNNKPVNHEPEILIMDSENESDASSEVVGGTMTTSPRPVARTQDLDTKSTAKETPTTAPSLYDMRGCTYARGSASNSKCYKSMSTVDRAKRIMSAANYVNKLHNTKFDGRYMLCTGYRESNFNPGAKGADGERGMFQVMTATGKAALRYGVVLPEFKGMSGETYMTKMANSTIAQVELSFLVLKMKLTEDAANSGVGQTRQKRIMSGEGSVDHYRSLAGRYNGGGYNSVYAKRISSCYSCLRGKIAANATSFGTEIQTCLNKAK
ncbi:hypothetical protein K2X05_06375 [bacterium]|nr:hypothetical protein [bacterium]